MNPTKYLTTREVAALLRVHYKTVERWAKLGRITFLKPHRKLLFPANQFDQNQVNPGVSNAMV